MPRASRASPPSFSTGCGTWSQIGGFTDARSGHTASLLPNGQVLVAAGFDNTGQSLGTTQLFNPATGLDPTVGLGTRNSHTATLLPGGRVLVAGGYGSTKKWPAPTLQPGCGDLERPPAPWPRPGTITPPPP